MDYSNPDVMLPTHEKQQHNNDMWDNGVGNEALRQQVSVTKRITSLGNERLESSLGGHNPPLLSIGHIPHERGPYASSGVTIP